jgi:hypothetical protein
VTVTGLSTAPVDAGGFGGQAPQTLFATANIAAVPEPSTWAMMIIGVGAMGAVLRRNRGKPIPTVFI